MAKYRFCVTEKNIDYFWVEADSKEEAESKAVELAQCEFESVIDVTATGEVE